MKSFGPCHPKPEHQLGIALLAGLMMLVAISLLALVATASMILQQHMAGNFSDSLQARQSAAFAVSQGKALLLQIGHQERVSDCVQNCFTSPLSRVIQQTADIPANPELEDSSWWRSRAIAAGIDPMDGNQTASDLIPTLEPPRFLIEEIHFVDMAAVSTAEGAPPLAGVGYYRILGRGVGQGPAAVAVDEAIIARPWSSEPPSGSDTVNPDGFCDPFRPWYDCGLMAWRQRR